MILGCLVDLVGHNTDVGVLLFVGRGEEQIGFFSFSVTVTHHHCRVEVFLMYIKLVRRTDS